MTTKQAGVIFGNWKRGNIQMGENMVKIMYDHTKTRDPRAMHEADKDFDVKMGRAIDAIFKNDYATAQAEINSAFTVQFVNFKSDLYDAAKAEFNAIKED